jgi:hypothetical protein
MSANKKAFLDLEAQLREIRDHIDLIDGTEFGKLEKLFDKLADLADKAIDAADTLEIQMDWEAEDGGAA